MNKIFNNFLSNYQIYKGGYGILVSKNNKIIFEKYKNNDKYTKFRIFSLTKPIILIAILLLVKKNKIKLSDKLNNFGLNLNFGNKITIMDLINHNSGLYDFISELIFNKKPIELYNKFVKNNNLKKIKIKDYIDQININTKKIDKKFKYNNTGYDLLGYIIEKASGERSDKFIRKNIFKKLKMNNSSFYYLKNKKMNKVYDKNNKIAYYETQNYLGSNCYVIASLRDYNKFINNYSKLLDEKLNKIFIKIYQQKNYIPIIKKKLAYIAISGLGDFSKNENKYKTLSNSLFTRYIKDKLNIIIYTNSNINNQFDFFNLTDKLYNYILSSTNP